MTLHSACTDIFGDISLFQIFDTICTHNFEPHSVLHFFVEKTSQLSRLHRCDGIDTSKRFGDARFARAIGSGDGRSG